MFTVKNNFDLQEESSCLIIGLFNRPVKFEGFLKQLDDQFDGQLTELVKSDSIRAKAKELSKIYTFGKIGAKQLYIVGLGSEKDFTDELLCEALGKTFKAVKQEKLRDVSIFLDSFATKEKSMLDIAHLASESFALATYQFEGYKQKLEDQANAISALTAYCVTTESEEISAALEVGYIYGKAVNSARTLVNLPGNMLTATDMANYAKELAEKYDFEIEILEKGDMEKLGMGALLAVNQGSTEPPKMIVLKHQGKEAWTDVIGELKTEQNVVAVIPATDNMINGQALKPDDVIVSMSGKTIEVLNTDAEGRLALADAMTYAKHHGANYLVDIATLTGGVIIALGNDITGALTNNESLFEQLLEASIETDEPIWRLPLFEKDKKRVRNSKIADLNNSPGREGHAIMGGAFVGEFAGDTPWVHLDIAGTATTTKSHDLGESGATGVMARTLALFVERFERI